MANQKQGLSVRSEQDIDKRVQVKIVDATVVSQQAKVDTDRNIHIKSHGNNPTGSDVVQRLSELGSTSVDGIYDATNNTDPSQVGLVAHTRAASPVDSDQILRLTGVISDLIHALDVSLHDEDGNPYSETNPLPTVIAESEGTIVNNRNKANAVAVDAISNHDYTVTAGKTLYLTQVRVSSSARMESHLQIETGVATGVFDDYFDYFTSVAFPNVNDPIREPIAVAAGVRVRVQRINTDEDPMDLYSTISGHEV